MKAVDETIRALITILFIIGINGVILGNTYYVAPPTATPAGSDSNAGTMASPWGTFQKAFNTADAGDTVYFRGGVYYSTIRNTIRPYASPSIGHCGTYANPIVYMGYPPDVASGDRPILDCSLHCVTNPGSSYNQAILLDRVEHVKFKDIDIRNLSQCDGTLTGALSAQYSRNLTFENMAIYNIGGRAIYMDGGAYNTWYDDVTDNELPYSVPSPVWPDGIDTTIFRNIDIHDICDTLSIGGSGNGGDGYKVMFYRDNYVLWESCRVWHYSDDALDPNNINGAHFVVNNCWVMSGQKYKDMAELDGGYFEGNGFKFSAPNYEDVTAEREGLTITNSLAMYCNGGGLLNNFLIDDGDPWQLHSKIYNNTFYKNGGANYGGVVLLGYNDFADSTTLRNNLSYDNYLYLGNPNNFYSNRASNMFESHNTGDWVGGWPGWEDTDTVTVTDADFITTDSATLVALFTAPRQADGSLPVQKPLMLKSTSDLINAGTNVGLPYGGASPDIGYAEYLPIIADHTVVDLYDDIPQRWIDSVKTKLVWVSGMSHGNGYFRGPLLLEALDPKFSTEVWYHVEPTAETSSYLRIGRPYWGAENEWTSPTGITNGIDAIDDYNATGNEIDVRIFGWSYQATWDNPPGGTIDPVYNVRWAGRTDGGLDGSTRWGLDAGDSVLTNNRVCVDTYINAWQQYQDYFESDGASTIMPYSTIIVDSDPGTEAAFQRELKSQHIRDKVNEDQSRILFDFSDILAYNNDGELNQVNWNDGGTLRPHNQIHPDNLLDYDASWNEIAAYPDTEKTILAGQEDHIGDVGTLRLGKALWWMLARIAGWDGLTTSDIQTDSTATDILTFTLPTQTGAATINTTAHTVAIEVAYTADVTDLTPTITLSYGATVSPLSGVSQDFTSPVTYTVTALDGTTTQEWVVTVTQEAAPATRKRIVLNGTRPLLYGTKVVIID